MTYHVKGWNDHYENNRTRRLKRLDYVYMPNKMHGDGYTALVDHPDGAAHLGAWTAIVQIASRCRPRGYLVRDDGRAMNASALARISRLPESVFDAVLPRLVGDEIGWLEETDSIQADSTMVPESRTVVRDLGPRREWKGREGNGRENPPTPLPGVPHSRTLDLPGDQAPAIDVEAFVRTWNENRGPMPAATKLTEERRRKIRARLQENPDMERWCAAIRRLASGWGGEQAWATIDFAIRNETQIVKIEEGKYDHRGTSPGSHTPPRPRNFLPVSDSHREQYRNRPKRVVDNRDEPS